MRGSHRAPYDQNHILVGIAVASPTPPLVNGVGTDSATKEWGIFGQVNQSTTFAAIRDGTSITIATGELQRINNINLGTWVLGDSRDGWVIGGDATGFSTGAYAANNNGTISFVSTGGKLANNWYFGSPGSDHPGGANYGMADGSVAFLQDTINYSTFALLGSMADAVPNVAY